MGQPADASNHVRCLSSLTNSQLDVAPSDISVHSHAGFSGAGRNPYRILLDEHCAHEGHMKSNKNVWSPENCILGILVVIYYLYFRKAFATPFFFPISHLSSSSLVIYHVHNKYLLQFLSGLKLCLRMEI